MIQKVLLLLFVAAILYVERCHVEAVPENCTVLKQEQPDATDGEHLLEIWDGLVAEIYCHNMSTDEPKEYITLKQGVTYSEVFRAAHNSGSSVFSKIRIILQERRLVRDDFTFADTSGPLHSEGTLLHGVGCGSGSTNAGLSASGYGHLDLRGTGFAMLTPVTPSTVSLIGNVGNTLVATTNANNDVMHLGGSGSCGGAEFLDPVTVTYKPEIDTVSNWNAWGRALEEDLYPLHDGDSTTCIATIPYMQARYPRWKHITAMSLNISQHQPINVQFTLQPVTCQGCEVWYQEKEGCDQPLNLCSLVDESSCIFKCSCVGKCATLFLMKSHTSMRGEGFGHEFNICEVSITG